MKLMFGDPFLEDPTVAQQRDAWRERILANDPQSLIRFGNAIFSRDDVLEALGALDVPIHVITGEQDRALPVRHAEDIARVVPDATLSLIKRAGHLCTIERPNEVNDVLIPFIATHGAATDERP
jgi:pimeloyl-ACP methyl ester carboxylesterase